ncbi:MAG: nucleotidyltransferase domain-containing protein [Clostridia bacterium]|nr:nucleotidyltransferase domain-containing protein [Clostridia bacterium]
MFDLNEYLQELISECKSAFGGRLMYVGLQGSYLRGEAKEDSDIDVMVILDGFSVKDMDGYRGVLKKIGYYEKSCGFICGREEMSRWNPLEISQLKNTTKDLYGTLSEYLPDSTRQDEINYVKFSLGNLYHELCQRYIHTDRENNSANFRVTCKGLFFLIQNLHYLESGEFVKTKSLLAGKVPEDDYRAVTLAELPDDYEFDKAFTFLFSWCQDAFQRIGSL